MNSEKCILIVGPFPPPVHGMSTTNAAISERLQALGAKVAALNTAAPSLDHSMTNRFGRIPRILLCLARLLTKRGVGEQTFYISAAGGFGQIYDLMFILIARLRGMRIFIRHCSFAYLETPKKIARVLVKVAGPSATHITQSQGMSNRLSFLYGAQNTVAISNAVLYEQHQSEVRVRQQLKTVGFLSNISAEKGVFEFLELMSELERAGLPVSAKLAGEFLDATTQRHVKAHLEKLRNVESIGPVYGTDKDKFLSEIDVLVFPTHYNNETEAKVNHEAMSRAIPVIAYGRGCIPEIIGADSGLVIDRDEAFVPKALSQIEAWFVDLDSFQAASKGAAARFAQTHALSQARWQLLMAELVGDHIGPEETNKTEDSSSDL